MLDMRTVFINDIFTGIVCLMVMIFVWAQNRKQYPSVSYWLLGFAFYVSGSLLLALRNIIPDFLSIVAANVLIAGTVHAWYIGLRRFYGKTDSQIRNYVILAVFAIIHTYFTSFQPNLRIRIINASAIIIILSLQCAWFIFRQQRSSHGYSAAYAVLTAFMGFVVISFARIVEVSINDPGNAFLESTTIESVLLTMVHTVFIIALTFGLVLLLNERLRLERQKADERYRNLVENMSEVIFTTNANGTLTYVSPAIEGLVEYHPSEIVGQPLSKFTQPEDLSRMQNNFQNMIVGGEYTGPSEYGVITKSGEPRWIWATSRPILEKGRITGIQGILTDITKRKQLDEKLRKLSQAVEQSPVSVVITDTQGNIEYVNPDFTKMTGYTPDEVIGQNPRIMKSGQTPSELYENLWNTILASNIWQGEMLNKKKNGELYWESVSISPIQDEHGTITHFVGVKEDITERKQLEEQRLQYNVERERVKILSKFIRDTSHELRTPLSTINMNTYFLRNITDPQQQQTRLDGIDSQIKAMNKLITSLVTMLKLDDNPELNLQPTNVNHIINDIHTRLQSRIHEKNLDLNILLSSGDALALGDAVWLDEALEAIVDNAIRYTADGNKIEISTYVEDDRIVIEVQDTGIGMSDDVLQRIFESFYRQDDAHTDRGFGLGLSIAKRIIDMHNGHIEVTSQPEQGSRFITSLPSHA